MCSYKFITMKTTRNEVLMYIDKCADINELVMFLELITYKTKVNTISETARINGISPNGVKNSKSKLGKQLMAIKS